MTYELPAPLAAALAAKGYDSLTAVQQAILTTETAGRDLLVSAQTGSGKTVAFGLAIADDIMPGGTLPPAVMPAALAIAPTRELALQVARELGWLYADAQIATCVGGMDYRTERRALERGAQIVVGTPGRLRDHIDRGSLDLSALRAAVLDEADEMLDLGFREDLEFILGAAPANRRTLMFSATVPPAIEALARDFQRDALRIAAMGEARQHGDISYRAVSVAPRDREPAIFNLLRFYEARTAIVFCKTRANVNHLLARMGNRGFKVVALSGELSQQERSHALQALRDGRARVCIATDVAARGIDLPGLELVIHADPPTNSETLLHRSGRTGRAGAKGVSALIVPSGEYKKAQRLLHHAKVEAEWGKAPSADDVRERDDARMFDDPALAADAGEEAATAATLMERFGAENVAAAFVRLWREGRPAPEELMEAPAPIPAATTPRPTGDFGPSVWFLMSVGHTGRAEARWLLPKICESGGISRDAIGAIRVRQDETFVQIAADAAPRFGEFTEVEPGLTMRRLDFEPSFERAPPKPRSGKPFGAKPRSDKPSHRKGAKPRDGEGFESRPREYTPRPDRKFEDRKFEAKPDWKAEGKAPRKAKASAYRSKDEMMGHEPAPRAPRGWHPDQGEEPMSPRKPRAKTPAKPASKPTGKPAPKGKPAAKYDRKAAPKGKPKNKPQR